MKITIEDCIYVLMCNIGKKLELKSVISNGNVKNEFTPVNSGEVFPRCIIEEKGETVLSVSLNFGKSAFLKDSDLPELVMWIKLFTK